MLQTSNHSLFERKVVLKLTKVILFEIISITPLIKALSTNKNLILGQREKTPANAQRARRLFSSADYRVLCNTYVAKRGGTTRPFSNIIYCHLIDCLLLRECSGSPIYPIARFKKQKTSQNILFVRF